MSSSTSSGRVTNRRNGRSSHWDRSKTVSPRRSCSPYSPRTTIAARRISREVRSGGSPWMSERSPKIRIDSLNPGYDGFRLRSIDHCEKARSIGSRKLAISRIDGL
jgi:hypothetical protein